jgi:hypothetical protein
MEPATVTQPVSSAVPAPHPSTSEDAFAIFAPYTPATRYQLDHTPWTKFLRTAVYITGRSNRVAARRDDNSRQTGTKTTTGSKSRYRFEGNRVLFHLFDGGAINYVGVYRQALQDTMGRIDYGDLSRDEQLAFWLNLHNAVLVHEIAKAHPISRPRSHRLRSHGNALLFDAKLVDVNGVKLSLNDIRYNIVYRYWKNPYVMYGFWDGAIGGPNIMTVAYSGPALQSQIERNGREFVNSMRGVDRIRGKIRISENYVKARPYHYPAWPDDLYNHLSRYAVGEAADIVDMRQQVVTSNRYAASTADVESGETVRFTGNDNPGAFAGQDLGGVFANLSSTAMRGGLTGEALTLARRSEAQKDRRVGTVVILDILTDDPGDAPERISVEENESADAEN